MEHDDIDEDIERLNVILQCDDGGEEGESDDELRVLENNEEEDYSNASRPSTSSDVTASSFPTTSMCTDADDAQFKFDPNTVTSETCLAMNRAYQEALLDTLRQIEISLIENRARQRQLEESVNEKVKKTDKQTNKDSNESKSFASCLPYFKDKSGNVPPYNEDVKLKEQMNEDKQHVRPKTGWSRKQRKILVDAVKIDALEQAVKPLLNKQEIEIEKLSRCKNKEEITEAKERIKKIQEEIKQKQNTPEDELLKNCNYSKIDFLKISCVSFNNKYNASECESMWTNVLRPGINRNKWILDEEEILSELVKKYNARNWEKIAEELGTKRTPYQCLQHYKQHICIGNASDWTEEEDELLKEVVETCAYGAGRVKWFQVAYYIDGRTADQCCNRWNKIDPKRNYGRWTEEEDKQLLEAVQMQGGNMNWTKIQEHVPTRNGAQCRERFVSRMSGTVLYKPWTYDDDKQLLSLYQEHGPHWVKIAKSFVGRNDNMVLLRHKRLVKWQRLTEGFYSQPKKVQKELKHQAFRFMKTGEVVPKEGLKLRLGKRGSIKQADRLKARRKSKSEVERLKALAGWHNEDSDNDDDDGDMNDDDDIDDDDDDEEDEEEMDESKRKLQDSLDAFVSLYNIEALDYFRQIVHKRKGDLVVPRPPPIRRNKMHISLNIWTKQAKLNDVVVSQIDLYVKQLQSERTEEGDEESVRMNLFEQISRNIKKGDDEEKKRMITEAFRGKNPCNLSVRELLNISKCIKEHGKPPKNPKEYDKKPWEVETSEEENGAETSETEEEKEEFQDEEEEPKKKKKPMSAERKEKLGAKFREHHNMMYQMKQIVLSKMDPKEYSRRGRRKQFLMYPKSILMKYRGLDEERRLNRKSLVLLMKTLDVNTRKAYFKAKNGKRKLSALAFLKTAERASLKRAKTRSQKQEIQETAKKESNMNTELSEVSDYLLDIKDELKINDDETDENLEEKLAMEETDEDKQHYGYNKSLPYIPPNRTTLLGMKTLLLEHRYLIDQADMYFNIDELKHKLNDLRKKGPNPLMSVLNAVRKTETAAKKQKEKRMKSNLKQKHYRSQMEEVRKTTAYLKLKSRFQSLFTWPALMATIQAPKAKPLPEPLQLIQRKLSVSDIQPEHKLKEETVTDAGNGVDEDVGDLPEEEAVEKLVDKIMEEYEKERSKKKRTLSAKKHRNFSEKRKQSFKDKERTKILKKLGLYEKMQEYKRQRMEAAKNNPSLSSASSTATSAVPSSTATSTVTPATATSIVNPATATLTATPATATSTVISASATSTVTPATAMLTPTPVTATSTVISANAASAVAVATAMSADALASSSVPDVAIMSSGTSGGLESSTVMSDTKNFNDTTNKDSNNDEECKNLSEVCQTDLPQDNGDMTENDKSKGVVGKRKRGRPTGSKTKCFSNTSPVRKSRRNIDTNAADIQVKTEELSPPKDTAKISKRGCQYTLMRSLIPDKMSKIASQIPDLPILNEPLPEKPVKPSKKPKEKKPPKEKLRVVKSKYAKDFMALMKKKKGKGKKTGPKLNRLLKKMKESEAEMASCSESDHLIKTEPVELEDEENAEDNTSYVYTFNEFEDINSTQEDEEEVHERIGSRKNLGSTRQSLPNNQDKGDNTVIVEQKSSQVLSRDKKHVQEKTDTETQSAINSTVVNTEGGTKDQKPLVLAVPVMISGAQQVVCIPFYPDKDGKLTLPNGKKVDATSALNATNPSMPMFNFDQHFQVLNSSQQQTGGQQQTCSQQQLSAKDKSLSAPLQNLAKPKDTLATPTGAVAIPIGSVSLLNPKMPQTEQVSLLNKDGDNKNSVTTKSGSNQTVTVHSVSKG